MNSIQRDLVQKVRDIVQLADEPFIRGHSDAEIFHQEPMTTGILVGVRDAYGKEELYAITVQKRRK